MAFSLIAIDLAKQVFQVCALDPHGRVAYNRMLSRTKLTQLIANTPPTTIALEACGSAHYWGRLAQQHGHQARLLPPQHVKPFCRGNKSDAGDALAIAEAARRPQLPTVPVKSTAQQDLQLLYRYRQRLLSQRTATSNQLRGFAAEYGVVFPVGFRQLLAAVPAAVAGDTPLTPVARTVVAELLADIQRLQQQIVALQRRLTELARTQPAYAHLQTIPGFGPLVTAAFLAAVGDGRQFAHGRQTAAWLGLVPRQHGSGGKLRLLGISKRGDRELRTALIHGARAVVRYADRRQDALGRWLCALRARRGAAKTIVALANKLARIAWAVLAKHQPFALHKAFAG